MSRQRDEQLAPTADQRNKLELRYPDARFQIDGEPNRASQYGVEFVSASHANSSSHSCQVTVNSCQGKHPESPKEQTVVLKYVQRQNKRKKKKKKRNPPLQSTTNSGASLHSEVSHKQSENVKLTSELWNFLFKFKEWAEAGLFIF